MRRYLLCAQIPELCTQQRLDIKANMKTFGVLQEALHSFSASSSRNGGEGAQKEGDTGAEPSLCRGPSPPEEHAN